jgi:hypothetical protein
LRHFQQAEEYQPQNGAIIPLPMGYTNENTHLAAAATAWQAGGGPDNGMEMD